MTRDVWLLIGQSNMQGCGLLREATAPDPRVFNFSSAGQWETAQEPLHRLWESYTPVHQDLMRASFTTDEERARSDAEFAAAERENAVVGAGMGLPFGIAMADATGREIGLIAAAHGGTSLEQWNPNQKERGESSLYGAALSRVKRALGSCPTARLRGALWYQGESDALLDFSDDYGARLNALIDALRDDLKMPELPFIAVQLGCLRQTPTEAENVRAQEKHWDEVREQTAQLPDDTPHCAVVAAIDLGLIDQIHIDTAGLVRLGKRAALQALSLCSDGVDAAPRVVKIEKADHPYGFGSLRLNCENVSGGWNPRRNLSGFSLHTPDGAIHPHQRIIAANAAQDDARVLELTITLPPDENLRLGYGLGFMPYANATDDRDMALASFLPRAVEL